MPNGNLNPKIVPAMDCKVLLQASIDKADVSKNSIKTGFVGTVSSKDSCGRLHHHKTKLRP
jgi:hypothetical protein